MGLDKVLCPAYSLFNLMRRHARSTNQQLSTLAHAVVRDPSILSDPTN